MYLGRRRGFSIESHASSSFGEFREGTSSVTCSNWNFRVGRRFGSCMEEFDVVEIAKTVYK